LIAGPYQHDLWLLAAALAIGLLIGVERGWSRREQEEGGRVAGVRTFALIGLLGGVCALIAQRADSPAFLGLCFLGTGLALTTAHVLRFRRMGDLGMTSLSAGAMAAYGLVVPAVSAAVVATLLLSFKPKLHAWLAHLTPEELQAALKLLLVSVVLLPILPDRGYGPWGVLNPYEIWWMVVLIAAVTFVGYVLVKVAGARRGPPVAGEGGPRSAPGRRHPPRLRHHVPAHAVPRLGGGSAREPPSGPAGAGHGGGRVGGRRGGAQAASEAYVQSPLDLGPAVRFGLLLSLIMLAAEALRRWLGEAGVYLVSAVSGITDVDAITLSLSRMADAELGLSVAATGIVLAAVSNTLVKAGIAAAVSRGGLAGAVLPPLLAASLLGALLALRG